MSFKQSLQRLYVRMWRVFRKNENRFVKNRWFAVVIALCVLLVFMTVVVLEEYVFTQDTIVTYFPSTTGIYAHADLNQASALVGLVEFVQVYQNVMTVPEIAVPFGVLQSEFEHNRIREIAWGMVPTPEGFQPAVVWDRRPGQDKEYYIELFEDVQWHVYMDNTIVIASPVPYQTWKPRRNHLGAVVREHTRLRTKLPYMFVQTKVMNDWLSRLNGSSVNPYIEQVLAKKETILLTFQTRGSTKIISEVATPLAAAQIIPAASWLDNIQTLPTVAMHMLDPEELLSLTARQTVRPHQIEFHVYSFLKRIVHTQVVDDLFDQVESISAGVWSMQDERLGSADDAFVVELKLTSSFEFQMWDKFVASQFGFVSRRRVTEELPDGSAYIVEQYNPDALPSYEYMQLSDQVTLITISGQPWLWTFVGDSLYITNNKELLAEVVGSKEYQHSQSTNACKGLVETYIEYQVSKEGEQEYDTTHIVYNSYPEGFALCFD